MIDASIELKGKGLPQDMQDFAEVLKLVLERVFSGIILCDKDCRVLYMNKFYADLLNADNQNAVGRHIEEFFPSSRLPIVIESGKVELGQKCSLRTGFALMVNRIPVKSDGKPVGVILQTVFKDYKEIEDLLGRLDLLENEVKYYKRGLNSVLSATYSFDSIIGQDTRLVEAKTIAEKYATTDGSVLVQGPTGTGKELFAHAIHQGSFRRKRAFVCVNCAAIPKDLLESELFGYETGAFTGANPKGKTGKIELAQGGTLFLDEIADLPLNAQAKLLRVLETKKIEKLGALKTVEVDFRLIAATNKNLRDMIERREFREDLFYRLNTMTVVVPSLSERSADIGELVGYFFRSMQKPRLNFSRKAMKILKNYSWPGNIRELKNVVERAASLADTEVIDPEHLPYEIIRFDRGNMAPRKGNGVLSSEMARHERYILGQTIKLTEGNMARAAKLLGISRSTLYDKFRKHNL